MTITHDNSSHIASSQYNMDTNTLDVAFRSGKTYRYHGVEPEQSEAFHNAKSVGSHLRANFYSKHKYTVLDTKPEST